MTDGFRRFSILLFVFLLAFLAVFVLRRLQGGETLADILPWGKKDAVQFKPEEFTLPDDPPLEIVAGKGGKMYARPVSEARAMMIECGEIATY